MFDNNFVNDIENISIQFHFGDCKILKNINQDWSYFYNRFKINDIEYKEENQTEVKFYKLSLMGQEFWGFELNSLFDKIFIGKIITIGDGKTAFEIVDIGFFDVGEPFATDRVYLQVAKDGMMPPMENSYAFFEGIGERFDGVEGVRVGSEEVTNSFDTNRLKKHISTLIDEKEALKNKHLKNEKYLVEKNQSLKKRYLELQSTFKTLEKNLENAKLQNDLIELDRIEKKLSEASKKIETVEINKENVVNQNKDYLIWSGENFKDFGVDFLEIESFEDAIERVKEKKLEELDFKNDIGYFSKTLAPKNEFETILEFEKRKKLFEIEKKRFQNNYQKKRNDILTKIEKEIEESKSNILNSWLGKQNIEMSYTSEIEKFDISINNSLLYFEFQIKVPREIAQSFKREVKIFECVCQYEGNKKLKTISIRKTFQNIVFETKINFNINIQIQIQKYTVTIDGLMYQNQPFIEGYTWKEAKEYARNLRLGEYRDWRLPTINELTRLLTKIKNRGKHGGYYTREYYIRKEFINNLKSDPLFWCSEEHSKENSHIVGIVDFNQGSYTYENKLNANYALCVRDI